MANACWQCLADSWPFCETSLLQLWMTQLAKLLKLICFLWSHLIVEANNLAGLIPICCTGQLVGWFEGQLVGVAMSCVGVIKTLCFQSVWAPFVCHGVAAAKLNIARDVTQTQSCKEGAEPWGGWEERSQEAPVESAAVVEEREVKKERGEKSPDCPSGAGAAVVPNADSFPNLNQSYKIWNIMTKVGTHPCVAVNLIKTKLSGSWHLGAGRCQLQTPAEQALPLPYTSSVFARL